MQLGNVNIGEPIMPFNNHFEEGYNMHSMTYFQQYKQFATLCSIPTRAVDSPPDIPLAESGWKLVKEECFTETFDAWMKYKANSSRENFVELADGIVDSVYVLLDFAHKLGVPFDSCWNAVHQNNMSKVWPDGTVHKDSNGKVMKPPEFKKVDLWSVIEQVAAQQCFAAGKLGAENWAAHQLTEPQPQSQFTRTQVDSSEQS